MGLFGIYRRVIVSIDLDERTCKVRLSNNKNTNYEEKTYKTINADFPIEAAKYIQRVQSKYPYTYIATMIKSENQGLLNGNSVDVFDSFGLDMASLKIMLVNKQWFIYVGKKNLQEYENKFSKIEGLDFVFSPFIIIYEKIKDRLGGTKKLYILQEKGSSSLLIADRDYMYFGEHVVFRQDTFIDENIIIKDKDSYESSQNSLSELSIANHMIALITKTLNNFYQDSRYASDFIDELLILDGYGISDNAISHLKSNTMLEIQLVQIDICKEIEKLVKMELT